MMVVMTEKIIGGDEQLEGNGKRQQELRWCNGWEQRGHKKRNAIHE